MATKQTELEAKRKWEEYIADLRRETPVENLTQAEIVAKRNYLEAHPIEWIQYFFPKYAKYPFAAFQKKAIKRILEHDEWYEVLSWSRELAKSARAMMEVTKLALTGRIHAMLLVSNSADNAERLLPTIRSRCVRCRIEGSQETRDEELQRQPQLMVQRQPQPMLQRQTKATLRLRRD